MGKPAAWISYEGAPRGYCEDAPNRDPPHRTTGISLRAQRKRRPVLEDLLA